MIEMTKVEKIKNGYIEMAQQRIDMMEEMPSASPTRIKWFEASKVVIPYLQNVASDEWVLAHDNATIIEMADEIKGGK
jgi:hypothetical protein